jgi:hypothetical protein
MPSLSNERVALLIARPADPLESTSALSVGNDFAAHNAYIRARLRSDRTCQVAAASTHGRPVTEQDGGPPQPGGILITRTGSSMCRTSNSIAARGLSRDRGLPPYKAARRAFCLSCRSRRVVRLAAVASGMGSLGYPRPASPDRSCPVPQIMTGAGAAIEQGCSQRRPAGARTLHCTYRCGRAIYLWTTPSS